MSEIVRLDDIRALSPVLLLWLTGLVVLAADLLSKDRATGASPMAAVLHLTAAAGAGLAGVAILASWDAAPGVHFGGSLRVDLFSRALSGVIILGTFLTLLGTSGYLRRRGIEDGEFHALVLLGAGAMGLLAQANDLIMVFLSLETFSMAVYILTGSTRDEKRSVEGALKYLLLGGLSSGFLLFGLALVFGATGEVRLDRMPARLAAGQADLPLLLAGGALVLVGFGFKLGAFPFHAWIPDAYEGAPTLVTGFMAVAVKTAGFAALTRLCLLLFDAGPERLQAVLSWALSALAIATCIFGNAVAIAQSSAKRMLAYSGIAHTGYLLIGLVAALSLPEASRHFAARGSSVVFYLLPYTLMTFGAFAIMAILGEGDADAERFDSFRGLSQRRPLLALCMLVFMMSLAGIPPTAGFWAKLYLFRDAVAAGRWDLALVGILTSIVAVYYYLRLVVVMYMQPVQPAEGAEAPPPPAAPRPAIENPALWAIGLAAAGTVAVGLLPDGLLDESIRSMRALLARI